MIFFSRGLTFLHCTLCDATFQVSYTADTSSSLTCPWASRLWFLPSTSRPRRALGTRSSWSQPNPRQKLNLRRWPPTSAFRGSDGCSRTSYPHPMDKSNTSETSILTSCHHRFEQLEIVHRILHPPFLWHLANSFFYIVSQWD